MKKIFLFVVLISTFSCNTNAQNKETKKNNYLINKTEAEWKKILPKMTYYVMRNSGTEPAFSGNFNKFYEKGIYTCASCNSVLYNSIYKYDSRSGWPSFDRGVEKNIKYSVDYELGYPRTELKCIKCGGHLGHLFKDGPKETTGNRHCINSASLIFIAQNKK